MPVLAQVTRLPRPLALPSMWAMTCALDQPGRRLGSANSASMSEVTTRSQSSVPVVSHPALFCRAWPASPGVPGVITANCSFPFPDSTHVTAQNPGAFPSTRSGLEESGASQPRDSEAVPQIEPESIRKMYPLHTAECTGTTRVSPYSGPGPCRHSASTRTSTGLAGEPASPVTSASNEASWIRRDRTDRAS